VAAPDRRVIALTIDASVQKPLEDLARERARALGPDISVAIVAIDHAAASDRAGVGADYFDERRAGQVDIDAGRAFRPARPSSPSSMGSPWRTGLIHPRR